MRRRSLCRNACWKAGDWLWSSLMGPRGTGPNATPVRGIFAEKPLKHKIEGNCSACAEV